MILVPVAELEQICADTFERVGSAPQEALRVARSLIGANLTGHDSHGVIRTPRYVDWVKSGDITPNQTIEVLVDTPALAVVDGRYGYGQTVAPEAVRIGVAKARETGLSAVALRDAGHIGRIGEWAEMAAAEGFVSIHFVTASGSILVAPFGARERRLSTAPFCVGIPRDGKAPVILDFATSVVAEGKVMVASQGGKKLPDGALVGPDGAFSTDPAMLYGPYTPEGPRDGNAGPGAIRAFGDHKGSGLAFMCEILGGSLTGTRATHVGRKKFANGMFSIYVDPRRVDPAHVFDADVSAYIAFFKSARPAQGVDEVLAPGEPERRMRAERTKNGVPLTEATWNSIRAKAREVGVAV